MRDKSKKMSTNPIRLQYLFDKYVHNTCTKQELKEFWQLVSELSEEDILPDSLHELYQLKQAGPQPSDQVDWGKFNQKLQQKMAEAEIDYSQFKVKRDIPWKPLLIAATLLCIVVLAWIWKAPFAKHTGEHSIANKSTIHQVITLPDGTLVTLNTGSKLDYPASFSGNSREVYLMGEAYFDVKHNPEKPFLVHTGKYITKVLGTAFNIKAYMQDSEVAVTVVRGKVQVSDNKNQVLSTLLPNEQLVVNKQTGTFRQEKTLAAKIIEWKAEDLVFEDITLGEAAIQISHRFGVEVKFDNEALRNCRFTASFQSEGIALKEVMDAITILTRSRWKKENNTSILLEGEGCK